MFEIINYYQGKLILGAIIALILCCVDASMANKEIDKINAKNSADYHIKPMHRAPFGFLIVVIIILVVALVLPLSLNVTE